MLHFCVCVHTMQLVYVTIRIEAAILENSVHRQPALVDTDAFCLPMGKSMPVVQDILVFFQTSPALDVEPAAWARYEASKGTGIDDLVEEDEPPYKSALAAMRDGWQVIQMSELKHRVPEDGYELGPLPYQTVLARYNVLEEEE